MPTVHIAAMLFSFGILTFLLLTVRYIFHTMIFPFAFLEVQWVAHKWRGLNTEFSLSLQPPQKWTCQSSTVCSVVFLLPAQALPALLHHPSLKWYPISLIVLQVVYYMGKQGAIWKSSQVCDRLKCSPQPDQGFFIEEAWPCVVAPVAAVGLRQCHSLHGESKGSHTDGCLFCYRSYVN